MEVLFFFLDWPFIFLISSSTSSSFSICVTPSTPSMGLEPCLGGVATVSLVGVLNTYGGEAAMSVFGAKSSSLLGELNFLSGDVALPLRGSVSKVLENPFKLG